MSVRFRAHAGPVYVSKRARMSPKAWRVLAVSLFILGIISAALKYWQLTVALLLIVAVGALLLASRRMSHPGKRRR